MNRAAAIVQTGAAVFFFTGKKYQLSLAAAFRAVMVCA